MDAQNKADDARRNGGHISKAERAALRKAAGTGGVMENGSPVAQRSFAVLIRG
jgi:hypothetical protein